MSDSEKIDLSKNLCVTEDAFDQFQAASAYDEDEFITLSDIVEPPQPTLDINAYLEEIQDDICSVSESNLQSDENITDYKAETSQEHLIPISVSINCNTQSNLASDTLIQHNQDIPDTTIKSTPKKRGRRRKTALSIVKNKKHCNMSSDSVSFDINKSNSLNNESADCMRDPDKTVVDRLNQSMISELDTTVKQTSSRRKRQLKNDIPLKLEPKVISMSDNLKPRKRGRPRKVQQHQTNSNLEDGLSLEQLHYRDDNKMYSLDNEDNVTKNSSKVDHDSSNVDQSSASIGLNADQTVNKNMKRKCRRTKATNPNNEVIDELENKDISTKISKQNSSISCSIPENEKSKSKPNDKKYDQIELELIRMLTTPTDELDEKINKEENDNKQKTKKKRGRKLKKLAKEVGKDEIKEKLQDDELHPTYEKEVDDEADDLCLSSLKKQLRPEDKKDENVLITVNDKVSSDDTRNEETNLTEISTKRCTKKPVMSDFEYNIDKVVCNVENDSIKNHKVEQNIMENINPEIVSPSKRPVRRKAIKVLHYDEGSDEDPFANVELSDDDDLSGRRGGRYYSDDEYIPGKRKKGKAYSESESSLSGSDELDHNEETVSKQTSKKKGRKLVDTQKKLNKFKKKKDHTENAIPDVTSTAADTTTQIDDDLDQSLQSPDITTNEILNQRPSQSWVVSNEFENFIAQKIQGTNIQIKKLTGTTSNESAITPLEIPVLDPNEPKKTVEVCTQTSKISIKTVEVQTTSPYESIMRDKITLTAEQSEKACDFLKGIVKNTSELGQLMIQKSEDFIQKKINTKNVTDTTKMNYCVQKSFLLFKLAKHNLIQMEEDLANEYEQFLKSNNMLQYRESPKCITANTKRTDTDSDCEIVEEPVENKIEKEKEKSKYNLKTVFLNKELSIKIAKKSTEEPKLKEKINMKAGRHTVWINDSIMVKKVKPTQSFLAQDSRNKKPPDTYVTIEMVKDFFDNYKKRQQVLLICRPFLSPDWLNIERISICNYFIAHSSDLSTHSRIHSTQTRSESNLDEMNSSIKPMAQPMTLIFLCTKVLHKCMYKKKPDYKEASVGEKQRFLNKQYQLNTLFRLSFNVISSMYVTEDIEILKKNKSQSIISLKKICLQSVNSFLHQATTINSLFDANVLSYNVEDIGRAKNYGDSSDSQTIRNTKIDGHIKSLFSLCIETIQKSKLCIQNNDLDINENKIAFYKIKSLKSIAFEKVKSHIFRDCLEKECHEVMTQRTLSCKQNLHKNSCYMDNADKFLELTIKSVNTLSDDIFAKLPEAIDDQTLGSEDDSLNFSNYDDCGPDYAESHQDDNLAEESNWVSRVQLQELKSCFKPIVDISKTSIVKNSSKEFLQLASIKIEPLEEMSENFPTIIKTEITENDDTINFNPLDTKFENVDIEAEDIIPEQTSSSYDVDAFEEFARTSKMLHTPLDCDLVNDDVFSQSALRVRKQHEPDVDDDFDTGMSLLIPQQNMEVAKDRLMKSSSDDEITNQKNVKRKRKIRSKVMRPKNKDTAINKNKNTPENEVALLTKKMKERIRQEEKTDVSSDSDLETLKSLATRQENVKKDLKEKEKSIHNEDEDSQIQCNDVDSTEKLNIESIENKEVDPNIPMKKSICRKKKETEIKPCVIQPDVPIELLECEPTWPMMYDDMENIDTEDGPVDDKSTDHELPIEPYIERHGWKCYPVNNNDTKIYENTYILLEKLPESFVATYFRYQDVADKNQDDIVIDRLTNLQTLHRINSKDNKLRCKTSRILANGQVKSKDAENDVSPSSPFDDDHYNELTPSEDEGADVDDEITPAPCKNATENVMAKNSLMDDADSDLEKPSNSETELNTSKIKEEQDEEAGSRQYRPGPKSKKSIKKENESTLLTADKMMNKELALLHAPVTLTADDVKVNDTTKKPSPKNFTRSSARLRTQQESVKLEEESSSEEEKQWVTTKEKLLKRLVKKQGNPSVDDAKRAKIVSEFIEKRGDAPDKRHVLRSRKRRSRRKLLERKKQMSILNRELFGESDTSYTGRKYSQAYGKGRRNIRKVIDKKSLARGTVIANMEEFERKRRLSLQQTRLREQLGCEEGVNVLVINDEVCLEYDFEQMRPVVTIHPFFTKVMKAHQYEGVKFMWDACFESLAMVASGHAGGGCILAHCMGLGKTLQVLALLHTVLTHPGVGMKRVLVCCPLSTVLNWVDEINKWIGPVTNQIKVFELSKLKKTYERAYQLEDWYKDGGIFIIGYELFRSLTTLDPDLDEIKPKIVDKIRHALLNPGPDVVICDEGHLLKNDASVLAVAMSRVATRRRIVLTGTPMQNNLREYYCMVNFVKPSLLGTYAEYSNRFENPIMNGQHRDSQEEDIKLMKARTHILHKVLEGCLQRQEASVLYPYLPKKHEYTVFIPPTKCQWDLYKHYIMTYALEQQQQHKQQKSNLLKDFHVLQKIWTHPQVLHNFLMKARDERIKLKEEKVEDDLAQEDLAASEDIKPNQTEVWWLQYLAGGDMLESLESSNKFVVVFQLLEEFITLGDKTLIFSTSLYTMDALEYFLKRINKWSLGQEYYRLDGSVPAEVRQKWCREFNAPHNVNTKLFLISTRAGCLGLNMTAANRVIILDTSWNPAHDIQSIFRVYRFGQKKDCYIYRLVAMGTMEQKIYERSVTKQAVSCRVVDEQQIDRHYNLAELTELYRYDEEGATVEAGLAAGVSDVALLRVAARARLHAVREHDSLLRGTREQHLPEHERNAAWMQFQQEHANTEMQDRLTEASQGIQRIMEADYVNSSESKPIKIESEVTSQSATQSGPKGKKNKKKVASNSTSTLEDSKINDQKDIQLDVEKEGAKVKKIMELLIKHNFHTSKRAHEIAELVANVRSIVDAGGAGLENSDELTRSIATVMLQEEDVPNFSSKHPPPLTDIVTEETVHPNHSEVKLELSPETREEMPADSPEQTQDVTPLETPNEDSCEGSLLVPLTQTTVKRKGRPRKYFYDEVLEPPIKRPRGRPRKNTTDTDLSSMDDETNTPFQVNSSQDSVPLGKRSKRLMGRPQKSYAAILNNGISDHNSSKEQIPATDVQPLLLTKANVSRITNMQTTSDSDINLIDDEDTLSANSESYLVPDVREEVIDPEVKKPRRAIAVKSTAKLNRIETNSNGKIKRKAALVAEKHLERMDTEEIVTLDDDDDEWNDHRMKLSELPQVFETKNKDKSKKTNIDTKPTSQIDLTYKKQKDTSILLSDDEDLTKTNAQVLSSGADKNSADPEPEEPVPLHPSMLSNPNFIKIVAYAYQSNRMLDEDAALLAARYSTQKALKEYETTGKSITSGPLYDIAVKVLTIDVLKKLQNKKNNKKNENMVTGISHIDSDAKSNKQIRSLADKDQEVMLIEGRNPPQKYQQSRSSEYKSQSNVVPVGLFRGSAVDPKNYDVIEECILPDDDDCILGTTDEPLSSSQIVYKKPNSQQFVITSVKATNPVQRETQPLPVIETIVPEIVSSIMVPAHQLQDNKITKHHPNAEPSATIPDQSKLVIGSNTPTYRLSRSKLKIEPNTSKAEKSNKVTGVQFKNYLTLTISDGKLVQSNSSVMHLSNTNTGPVSNKDKTNNVQSSNDTICLDSDEEDVTATDKTAKVQVPITKPLMTLHSSIPTPVAVTTCLPNVPFNANSNNQDVNDLTRGNDAQAQATSGISPEAQTEINKKKLLPANVNITDNANQVNDSSSMTPNKAPSTLHRKFRKIFLKPSENAKGDTPQISSKKIIRPEDILNGAKTDVQLQKLCKAGDIVRINKQGNLSVLSRVIDSESLEPSGDNVKSAISSRSSVSSSSGNDPLSILKDVIHIQANEYDDEPRRKTQLERSTKSIKPVEDSNHLASSKITSKKTGNIVTLQYKTHKDNNLMASLLKKPFVEPPVQSKSKDTVLQNAKESSDKNLSSKLASNTIDLTNLVSNNKTVAIVRKSVERPSSKGSVIIGSSKDIILRAKSVGSTLIKASSSTVVTKPLDKRESTSQGADNKKRTAPGPHLKLPKKKIRGLSRPGLQTLEDFDIDDIDDIIELE